MPDPRFFEDLGPVSLADLAALTGAELANPDLASRQVRAVSILDSAGPDAITFLSDRKRLEDVRTTSAGACFVIPGHADALPPNCAALVTAAPYFAYAVAAARLHRPRTLGPSDPAVSPLAEIETSVRLSPGVVVGAGAQIGRGSRIGPNTVIGPGVAIGRDCEIEASISIGFALLGDRVRILSGARIGDAGFGATAGPKGLIDIPQLGRVILQDGVSIGANSCVDRGAFEDTSIGENTKIDNLVQIGHNCRIGRNCAMAAHTGISGSVVIGDGVQLGGRAGVADHLTIGAGARIGAAAGVVQDVPPGETWGGFPAKAVRQWLREVAWLSRESGHKGGRK
ncbi:UDP-3-O-(3-hydroxymyristoyl)glucosamine N-acyltransferase [Phenylobacterium sp.]|jgi:UDP-3-O-[3-hydroxymyristoyl] glucosamine N-acyltransferase|uniref:UDP-3-O-(3-hydroxymyristoyl)glucosamine N-acyltransferase n=1 Tax=Phenylobacterium sp. TaxID=1871053 RepID=UPI002F423C33